MVAKQSLGVEGSPFEMDIERGKIDEFSRAIRAGHPDHFHGSNPVVPPTFLTTQFFWEKRVEGANPWDLVQMSEERGMHAEQEYIFHGPPPRAGDRLVAQSRITELYDKASRSGNTLTFVKMVTEYRDPQTDRLVAEAVLTGVERQP
jgi:hypothetical protein